MLKPLTLACAMVVFLGVAAVSRPAVAAPPQNAAAKATPASLDKAKKLYNIDCALCHGETGNGKTDMATSLNVTLTDFSDPKTFASKTDQEIFDSIRKGKGDKMPPEDASRAKDDDVKNLVIYLRSLSKNGPAPAAAPADAAPAAAAPASPNQ